MIKKQKRKAPLACRPDKEHEWLYDKIGQETRERKITNSALLQEVLATHYTTIYEPKTKKK